MNAENPSMAKFQVVKETRLPHMCIACRRNATGQNEFVDLGLSLDVEDPLFIGVDDSALGALYLCRECVEEMARVVGFAPPSLAEEFSRSAYMETERADRLEAENDRLRALNESYTNVLRSLGAISDPDESSTEVEERRDSIFTRAEQGSSKSGSK